MVKVVVDAMGGDEPPETVLKGIELALEADKELTVVVAGGADVVEPFCKEHDRTEPLVTTEVIAMDEHPAQAVRAKRDSSIVRGCKAVAGGEADAFFSAGSTGAILTAATLYVKRLKGVSRPCLAAVLPGLDGHQTVVGDLGANADCRPEMIVQFAEMCGALAKVEAGCSHEPSVGLLSNGTEDTKGSEQSQTYFRALTEAAEQGAVAFAGNCEGKDLLCGDYDVIVTDGFTGNVALKSMEGTAKYIAGQLKAAAKRSPLNAIGALLIKGEFARIAEDLSGDKHGGAVLLGLRAPVLVGHGKTSPQAVKNGTLAAVRCVNEGLTSHVAAACAPTGAEQ